MASKSQDLPCDGPEAGRDPGLTEVANVVGDDIAADVAADGTANALGVIDGDDVDAGISTAADAGTVLAEGAGADEGTPTLADVEAAGTDDAAADTDDAAAGMDDAAAGMDDEAGGADAEAGAEATGALAAGPDCS